MVTLTTMPYVLKFISNATEFFVFFFFLSAFSWVKLFWILCIENVLFRFAPELLTEITRQSTQKHTIKKEMKKHFILTKL